MQQAFKLSELQENNQQLHIEIRATNRDLVAINRKLSEAINSNQKQMDRDELILNIAREALQFVPTPIIGVDEDGMIIFTNSATEQLFVPSGSLLGTDLAVRLPFLSTWLAGATENAMCDLQINGGSQTATWYSMGQTSRSCGKLIVFSL